MIGRILGIDFGLKRIGLAISDPMGITAYASDVLTRTTLKEDKAKIVLLIDEHEIQTIVIGLPLNMNGSEGYMVRLMREFADELKKEIDIDIIEYDERLTSYQASKALNQAEIRGKRKKKRIDSISAQIILQTYLDSISS
jgi:putative Holliday junction resolvase